MLVLAGPAGAMFVISAFASARQAERSIRRATVASEADLLAATRADHPWRGLVVRQRYPDLADVEQAVVRHPAVGDGLAVALVIALTAGTAWRALETQEPIGSSTRDGRHLIDQVREEYPTLPSDGRLVLVDVPWTLVLFGDTRLRDALRIYYGDIEVRGFKSEKAFLDAKLQIRDEDTVYYYRDAGGSP